VLFYAMWLNSICFAGLLKLQLLPVSVLNQKALEQMYSFHRFSSVITQAFHSLYHRDCNVLLAASADKQRVIAAELAIFRVMSNKPGSKVFIIFFFSCCSAL
jgi:activating signal cointegrator complex subunit 3